MPTGILSSLVFVGGEFAAAMFDERSFCEDFGSLDKDQIKIGPIGRFSYAGGKYGFWVAPDRIDIRCNEMTVIPEILISASRRVISILEPAKRASVSGIGINCDAIFEPQEVGQEGSVFCRALTATPTAHNLPLDVEAGTVRVTFSFLRQGVRYNIRIEPEGNSQGKNLLIAINGHQVVTDADLLVDKLAAVDEIRNYVAGFHHGIAAGHEKGA